MKRNILLILCAIFFVILSSLPASALTIDLVYEFDGNSLGTTSYGTVDVAESGGNLNFTITANTANLGGGDIHEFYFNLLSPPDPVTGLAVTSGNWTGNAFSVLSQNPSIAGGAGAAFDWGVNFGNGAGPSGNGTLTIAIFTLSADQDLTIADLMELSSLNNTPDVLFAVHFQGTSIFGADSETVGGQVPIPAPIFLLGTGLVGLVGFRKRTKP